ncbi:hypothetical protein KY290_005518 [Solanum tuberosum]|uniref:RNase H type-1 domain-containing protein n=1 Tax=Solanum tuberosum TaxID=4113 RepID=A0ABQ7WED4_SOLTU|nr:hypothetical protein KY289_005905 [Solanum tuberosum]KAH0779091.1 hypothetical protein KY290_005518 [Solanum tuberosum]
MMENIKPKLDITPSCGVSLITENTNLMLTVALRAISEVSVVEGNFQFIHIFREGNTTADLLTNFAELDRKNDFTETIHLPRKIVATMKNDEGARPNFRIRLRKNTFIFDPG